MPRKTVHWLVAAASLVVFAGCCAAERQSSYPPPPPPPPVPPAPCNRCANSSPIPARFTPTPTPVTPPVNYYTPPPAYTPPPNPGTYVPPSVRLAPPEAVTQQPEPPREVAKVDPPQTVEPPPASIPSPLVKSDAAPTPRLKVDIPFFTLVKPRVASGQQPFPDGIDWLQTAGYRTVLHIREPGDRSTIAQHTFEKRGLTYVSLEMSPQNLTKESVDRFNKLVTDEASQPLFVYDHDNSLTGALWYVHFRTVGGLSDEKARTEAERLHLVGFPSDKDDHSRLMWNAVQNYLRSVNP